MELASKPRILQPAGTHTAVCYQMIDLGTQKIDYQGNIKMLRRVIYGWELSEELMEDGRPYAIGKEFSAVDGSKAKIVEFLTSWLAAPIPKGFKLEGQIGKACNLTVVHAVSEKSGEPYAKIGGIAPLKKSEKAPQMRNIPILFQLGDFTKDGGFDSKFDQAVFNGLPEWIQEKIKLSPEYAEAINAMNGVKPKAPSQVPQGAELNDEIPF